MAGNFMAGIDNSTNHLGSTFGNPSQSKKSRSHISGFKYIKYPIDIGFYTQANVAPVIPIYDSLEG
ncbi:hypothetical protein BJI67_06865 [Acidihalobacter aeolianus]|uniref:Uncharacterized protein n=1 Tax=Acidihalobacter aeolianus TaxID=2792603 RepID=A0A1D8K765_9GAMM|nr:hypothetical protein BJI67_06865 [Acidihalobacter aeolianus]